MEPNVSNIGEVLFKLYSGRLHQVMELFFAFYLLRHRRLPGCAKSVETIDPIKPLRFACELAGVEKSTLVCRFTRVFCRLAELHKEGHDDFTLKRAPQPERDAYVLALTSALLFLREQSAECRGIMDETFARVHWGQEEVTLSRLCTVFRHGDSEGHVS